MLNLAPARYLAPNPFDFRLLYKKHRNNLCVFVYARDEGIEPPLEVLETPVLPLYESRNSPAKPE